jgi:hypothetical protein
MKRTVLGLSVVAFAATGVLTASSFADGKMQMTNLGELRALPTSHNVLTVTPADRGTGAVLYAPSEGDDPAYRAAIAACTGGVVDYFNASSGTPTVDQLSLYDCVHVWANFAFADNVGYGNNLAAFADGGGTVVLGAFCTYTSGNFLSGAIMTAAYCPVVSPAGNNHFATATDGQGDCCEYSCVTGTITAFYRDFLVTQGAGVACSNFIEDNEIATGHNTSGPSVIYCNGSGGAPIWDGSQVGAWVGSACLCSVGPECKEDVNNDGIVDILDLLAVLAAWGTVCP